jgi:hypothetical protein
MNHESYLKVIGSFRCPCSCNGSRVKVAITKLNVGSQIEKIKQIQRQTIENATVRE